MNLNAHRPLCMVAFKDRENMSPAKAKTKRLTNMYNWVECACVCHHNIQFMGTFHNILEIHIEIALHRASGRNRNVDLRGKLSNAFFFRILDKFENLQKHAFLCQIPFTPKAHESFETKSGYLCFSWFLFFAD